MKASKKFWAVAGVLALIVVVGLGAYGYQLYKGLTVTGMNNGAFWGLYIANFMFFVGLSAGGLIVASSASVFHIKAYKVVSLPAVILSTVCISLAGMFVLIDMGGIQRVWRMLTSPNPTSPLLWDVCVITAYLIINIIYLYFMLWPKADREKIKYVSRFALPVAILVHSVTAWIFGLQIGRSGWYTAIMAPLFVVSAMDSGLAGLLIVLRLLNKYKVFFTPKSLLQNLTGLLTVCIAADAYFIGSEILTMAYPGAEGYHELMLLLNGPTAPFFLFEVIGGLLIPFMILVFSKNRKKPGLVNFACALVVLGVFCKRIWLLFTAFIHPNLYGGPGIASGSTAARHAFTGIDMWATHGYYSVSPVEVMVMTAVIALGILAFMIMAKLFFKPEDYQPDPNDMEGEAEKPVASAPSAVPVTA